MFKVKKIAAVVLFSVVLALANSSSVSASAYSGVAYPHPYLPDEWRYGVTNHNWAYSEYYMMGAGLGSYASVTDLWGNIKSRSSANYGWARAGAIKTWTWGRANAYYGWYQL